MQKILPGRASDLYKKMGLCSGDGVETKKCHICEKFHRKCVKLHRKCVKLHRKCGKCHRKCDKCHRKLEKGSKW